MGGFDPLFVFTPGVFGINMIIFRPQVTHFAMGVGRLSAYVSTFQRTHQNIHLCAIHDFIVSFYGVVRNSV